MNSLLESYIRQCLIHRPLAQKRDNSLLHLSALLNLLLILLLKIDGLLRELHQSPLLLLYTNCYNILVLVLVLATIAVFSGVINVVLDCRRQLLQIIRHEAHSVLHLLLLQLVLWVLVARIIIIFVKNHHVVAATE